MVVPDVRGQLFVFASGALEDNGFGWKVRGAVEGYPSNLVVAQSPEPGHLRAQHRRTDHHAAPGAQGRAARRAAGSLAVRREPDQAAGEAHLQLAALLVTGAATRSQAALQECR